MGIYTLNKCDYPIVKLKKNAYKLNEKWIYSAIKCHGHNFIYLNHLVNVLKLCEICKIILL